MTPQPTIAHYRIISKLGEGGMGEVFRARDTKLDRDVAIKILPQAVAQDAERIARFEREAKVLAALNHPNIAAIYGLEKGALVMELIEGETLAGPLPLDTALNYARQIAAALEAAHEKGIVHRDLKPANIMITAAGMVKVLDFGLAAVTQATGSASGDPGISPTLTIGATQVGMILGTAGYMSPEQARGKPVDKRADIWAFGVVLYELITGRKLFAGEDVSTTLASVIKEEPRWDGIPPKVQRLLKSCLEKDPKQRLRDIGDAWRLLEEGTQAESRQRPAIPWAVAAGLAVIAAIALWGWLHAPVAVPRPVTRWTVTLPQNSAELVALSRDGTRLMYGDGQSSPLMLRMMNEFEARPLAGTEGARGPVFSPDGQWLAYVAPGGSLKKVPVTGGAPVTLGAFPTMQQGRTWGENDTIVVGTDEGLMQISAAGGPPRQLTTVDAKNGETSHRDPEFLPGGHAALFTITASAASSRIAVLDLRNARHRVLVNDGNTGRYVPTGHLVYLRGGTLFAAPFDTGRLAVTGPAVPATEGISDRIFSYSFSNSGLLAYIAREPLRNIRTIEWVDRKGNGQATTLPGRVYLSVRLSPDGLRVAASIAGDSLGRSDIWIGELERGTLTRLTDLEAINWDPVWSPDGRRVAFLSTPGPSPASSSGRANIYWVAADGSGKPELLLAEFGVPDSWTPDGKTLLYSRRGSRGLRTGGAGTARESNPIWILPMDGSAVQSKPRRLMETSFTETNAQVSPDGHWMAYESNDTGTFEVYVRPFPDSGGKTLISTQGGSAPRWSRSGRELFYQDPKNRTMAVDVQTGPVLRASRPRALFEVPSTTGFGPGSIRAGWDVAPDGSRFLVIKPAPAPASGTKLQVVSDWFEELRSRVPVKR